MGLFKKPAAHLLLVALLGIAAYSGTFHVPFVFDDVSSIPESPAIKDLGNFLTHPGDYAGYSQRYLSRYVGYLSFALNYMLCGLDVRCYHAVNLAIHITNALLVYLLIVLTFGTERLKGSSRAGQAGWTALLASAAFVVHPVETQAVTYIVQRLASLAGMFYLASLVFYIKARTAHAREGAGKRETYVLYLAALVFALLAMKTKETALTLPLVALMYEMFFFEGRLPQRLLFLLPMLLMLAVIPLTELLDPVGNAVSGQGSVGAQSDITRWDYLLTQSRVIVTYIRLLLLPVNQNLDYDYPVLHSLFDLRVMGSLITILCMLGAAAWMYVRARKGNDPAYLLASFGIVWFFVTLSVESSVIPIKDVIFEHRVYLPSVGIFMTASCLGAMADRRWSAGAKTPRYVAAGVVLALFALTLNRNTVWTSDLSLWQDSVGKSPGKARPHFNLGKSFTDLGQVGNAIDEYRAALKIMPDYADAHHNLGLSYLSQGLVDQAMDEFRTALKLDPGSSDAHNNMGMAYIGKGKLKEAMSEFLAALESDPGNSKAYNNMGIAYSKVGQVDMGIWEFRTAIRLNPDNANAHFNLGHALNLKGAVGEAVVELEAAARLKPDDPDTRNELGVAYAKSGMIKKAVEEFRAAVRLRPQDTGFRKDLEQAILSQ